MEEQLKARYDGILARISVLEADQALIPEGLLAERQVGILHRIQRLCQTLGVAWADVAPTRLPPAAAAKPRPALTMGSSPTQQRLEQELIDKGCTQFEFVRVPADYYDHELEFRQACLRAPTIHHLCKSIVMENTRSHPSVTGWTDPAASKYFLIIVQYTARLHSDKLKAAVMKASGGAHGSKYYNMRLASEEANDLLTGFSHNAVSPVGLKEPLPIILSHRIAQLQPQMFWMGGGEVDLKLGVDLQEFLAAYQPMVADCTYDSDVNSAGAKD